MARRALLRRRRGELSRSPELIGHRGAPRERPENTLASFLRALDLGADAVELDVHATRDGVVVVHHDFVPRAESSVAALGGRPIAELTAADLGTFQVAGEPIPTLASVLEAIGGRATVYVEIKGRDIEEAVIATIESAPSAEAGRGALIRSPRCGAHPHDAAGPSLGNSVGVISHRPTGRAARGEGARLLAGRIDGR